MSEVRPEELNGLERKDEGLRAAPSPGGTHPYATGGGGVTFERKVAVKYLAHLLVGDGATEIGEGRFVTSVEFQQAPSHAVDDLVVRAARSDESQPSLVLALGIRRAPRLVPSDESTRKLVRQFVRAVINTTTDGSENRLGLVVAGPQRHTEQLANLATLAAGQMDAPGFFELVCTPSRFDTALRRRLNQLTMLVERALRDLGVAEPDTAIVQQRVWELLARLTVSMPRLESPDETDWTTVTNSLIQAAQGSDVTGASRLRDRLVALASEYSPIAARVDLTLLRRDVHAMLDPTAGRHQKGWQALDHLHLRARSSVRDSINANDDRRLILDRSAAAAELVATTADAAAVVVSGESGVGKSALAVLGITAAVAADPDGVQVLCINLRHIPKLTVQLEATLGCPLSTLLCELSAPKRMLIIDGADAIVEGMEDAFRYLADAALESDVKVIAVTSVDSKQVVRDTLAESLSTDIAEHSVAPLTDTEIDTIVQTFTELNALNANPRSRELLRRLVVVDLLVRSRVSGAPLSDADAMREVWSGLVRRHEMSDRGSPDAREFVLLKLATLEFYGVSDAERLDAVSRLDFTALDGLRRDDFLRTSHDDPFMIGPEFSHDEVRRYAVARFLLVNRSPALRLKTAGAPRWSLAAARLACQELLAESDKAANPLRDRFSMLQASFDALVEAGHGARWGDVPGEALLTIGNPGAVLRDAWPELLTEDAAGLRRLCRLVDQRLRDDNGIVDHVAVEPIITLLLEDGTPWRSGEYVQNLLRSWLHGHVIANTAVGHRLRILLRERLVEACAEADRRLAKMREDQAAARVARTPEEIEQERQFVERHDHLFTEIGYGGRRRRPRPEVPHEITDKVVLELLALLGPDLGDDGEAILLRVARDAPSWLAPAVEELLTGRALASSRRGLLARLTEAYYLDDEADGSGLRDEGIRSHNARSFDVVPLAASYRGPFMALFQTDFRNGIAVLNRLLNHAARIRAQTLARLDSNGSLIEDDAVDSYRIELNITGARRGYFGDEHVWRWYRGTGVGPYPCISALLALEQVCDQLIETRNPVGTVVSILLDGCENLAMVGLVVGLLARHLENADHLLAPYLTEPQIWQLEFARVAQESSPLAVGSDGLVAPERRKWSLRDVATFMLMGANEERASELRALGEKLVANARREMESLRDEEPMEAAADASDSIELQLAHVRSWACSLDRDTYQVHEAQDGLVIQSTPPENIVQALEPSTRHLEHTQKIYRLVVRYYIDLKKECSEPVKTDELVADLASARKLLAHRLPSGAYSPWDASALVAAVVLEAHFLDGADLSDEALCFAADIVLRVGEGEAPPRLYDFEETPFEEGADRSAARVLPLLLLPAAARLRADIDEGDGSTTFERSGRAGVSLAQAVANEVRLHLARGLDPVWKTPCAEDGRCHHEAGWRIATETMRDCVLGGWDQDTQRHSVLALKDPVTESLTSIADRSIRAFRLDAAIRALAPAAMADVCVSTQARDLLLTLLAAQRRSLLSYERDRADHRGSRTLVSARALLTLAENGDDTAIYEHIDAYAHNPALIGNLLRSLSAAAEETPGRAATSQRIWPSVVRRMLELNESEHTPFRVGFHGDIALAALMPNAASEGLYFYQEVRHDPIPWWKPLEMQFEVEAWLPVAAGRKYCVDQLVSFLRVLTPEDQVCTGLPWVEALVLADPGHTAGHTFMLPTWLIEIRSGAGDAGLLASWQKVVDALVVAGVTQLAPYSE